MDGEDKTVRQGRSLTEPFPIRSEKEDLKNWIRKMFAKVNATQPPNNSISWCTSRAWIGNSKNGPRLYAS